MNTPTQSEELFTEIYIDNGDLCVRLVNGKAFTLAPKSEPLETMGHISGSNSTYYVFYGKKNQTFYRYERSFDSQESALRFLMSIQKVVNEYESQKKVPTDMLFSKY